jgi:two-component system, OmpR family, phosphate regulon sensor histidine kinase PhoR
VVADPDPDRRAAAAGALEEAGYSVLTAGSREDLSQQLDGQRPDLVVLDPSLAGQPVAAPVLLLVDLNNDAEKKAAQAPSIADYVTKPLAPAELVHRADTVISRARYRRSTRQSAERLREKLRNVSAALRTTNKPQVMADYLVQGLGETFGASHVLFATFEDDRVPLITAQWHLPEFPPLPPFPEELQQAAQGFIGRLWKEADVLTIRDLQDTGKPTQVPAVRAWAKNVGARGMAVVPVGDGELALGVLWIVHQDGPRSWSRVEISLIQHVAGNMAHGLMQGHLIIGQQEVVRQLRQLDRAKTDFLATVNHELRTPLTSITAYLDMIRDGAGGPIPDGVDRMLDVIVRNSERLRRLVDDMLTVSRQDYERQSLRVAPVQVSDTLRIITAALRPLAELRNVDINLNAAEEDLVINADAVQLEQVFTNLVSNAIKFTPGGGRITVTSEPETDTDGAPLVSIKVTDTGVGIPEEEIPHLFTRFYRASNATASAVPGTGLGLAIAEDILKRHRGHLAVRSKLGSGTTVEVRLPVAGP